MEAGHGEEGNGREEQGCRAGARRKTPSRSLPRGCRVPRARQGSWLPCPHQVWASGGSEAPLALVFSAPWWQCPDKHPLGTEISASCRPPTRALGPASCALSPGPTRSVPPPRAFPRNVHSPHTPSPS